MNFLVYRETQAFSGRYRLEYYTYHQDVAIKKAIGLIKESEPYRIVFIHSVSSKRFVRRHQKFNTLSEVPSGAMLIF